jgi:phosphate transport system substrate-binding protein
MVEEWITPKAIVLNSNGSIGQQVELDPDAIGFISLGLVKEYNVKAVNLDGIAPTNANVANGSYSLSRPFLFITKGESTGKARQFIDFILSKDGQDVLVREGLISVNEGKAE